MENITPHMMSSLGYILTIAGGIVSLTSVCIVSYLFAKQT